jgi:hypothetical protein
MACRCDWAEHKKRERGVGRGALTLRHFREQGVAVTATGCMSDRGRMHQKGALLYMPCMLSAAGCVQACMLSAAGCVQACMLSAAGRVQACMLYMPCMLSDALLLPNMHAGVSIASPCNSPHPCVLSLPHCR